MEIELKSNSVEKYNETCDKAASYARVSTLKQSEEGYSIENQMKYIEEYAKSKGWILEDSLKYKENKPASKEEDESIDESNFIENFRDRPMLTKLLKEVQKKSFKHLIVYSRDRLARDVEDAMALEIYFEKFGIQIHYAKPGEDFEDANPKIKRLLNIIFTSLAEMEINILSSRVKEGSKAAISKGNWAGGKVPFGYIPVEYKDYSKGGNKKSIKLKVSELDSSFIKKIFELYSEGYGYRRIAQTMNKEYGFIIWTKSKIEAIIKNKTYTGYIFWDRRGGRRNPNRHNDKPIHSPLESENVIIDEDFWEDVSNERQTRNVRRDAFYYDTDYILKSKLVCSKCKRPMKAKYPGVNRTSVYRCANTKEERTICNTIIPCNIAEEAFLNYMREFVFQFEDTERFWSLYEDGFNKRIEGYRNVEQLLEQRKKKAEELMRTIRYYIQKESDEHLLTAFEIQLSVYDNLINKYDETLEMFKKKTSVVKKSRKEVESIVQLFLPSLFTDIKVNGIKRLRREFIIRFIDKIEIRYDKITKKISIDKIVFLPPELM
ncbi:recombinase family protein [Clostridium sp. HMP27]|uniref:recombinase family protein n=1 Tax=Clostridium sp. HMP27 TaxID=1487921 RepID=UPI00052C8063|nr:recombinase family protein [Clostridium sp. HMP27]KGK84834.1 hypothetical protein DP68_16360 [Clostridium sp. HMP27]